MPSIPAFSPSRHPALRLGDHAELARVVLGSFTSSALVWCEGDFWELEPTHQVWRPVHRSRLARFVMSLSGTPIGSDRKLMVNRGTIDGTLRLLADLVDDPKFFDDPANKRDAEESAK